MLTTPSARSRGFTLTELAIVMLIISLLIGGLLTILSAQTLSRENADTKRLLEATREAMLGFAVKNGRLPCPASGAPGSQGVESFVNTSAPPNRNLSCTNYYDGFVPALTLGLTPTDASGYLLDAWGNRVRYAVSSYVPQATTPPSPPPLAASDASACWPSTGAPNWARCPTFTTSGAIVGFGMTNIDNSAYAPFRNGNSDLQVCDSASCLATGLRVATPAVIYSPGKTFPIRGSAGGTDEQTNFNAPLLPPSGSNPVKVIVAHEPRDDAGAAGGQFDDIVVWISPYVLYSRIIAGGAL